MSRRAQTAEKETNLKQTQSADSKTHEWKKKKEPRKEQRRGKTGKRRSGCWCKEENEETQEGGKGERGKSQPQKGGLD